MGETAPFRRPPCWPEAGRRVALGAVLAWWAVSAGAVPGEGPWFTNVAPEAGLAHAGAKRVVFVDLDGDGWLDVVLDLEHVFLAEPGRGAPTFREATHEAGLNEPRPGTLLLFGDVDSDGDRDLLSVRYQEPDKAAPDPDDRSAKLLDADGNVVPARPDDGTRTRIYLNDGRGRFEMMGSCGLEAWAESTSAATFLDHDLDGRLDVFLGNWYREYGWSLEAHPDRLLRGQGDGSFVDVTAAAGFDETAEPGTRASARPTYGVTTADWNGDGWPDILTASYGRQWNRLWANRGDGTFADVAADVAYDGDANRDGRYRCIDRETEAEFRANGNTFDVAVADRDNDGDLDVFLGEITHWWAGPSSDLSALLTNLGPGSGHAFERRKHRGLARPHEDAFRWNQGDIHVGWVDFDNDTRLDLLVASGDYPDGQYLRLYRQLADGSFRDETSRAGFDWEGCGSLSLGDYDRDGDVDVLVGRSLFRLSREKRDALGPAPALFRNDVGQDARWITLRLVGAGPPRGAAREAIGATVRVTARGVTQTRQVMSSRGHAGHQDAPELHFGLGDARRVERLEVRWPDARHSTSVFTNVATNRHLEIRQTPGGPATLRRIRHARRSSP